MDITTFSKIHSGSPVLTADLILPDQTQSGHAYLPKSPILAQTLNL